jgi:uncharacterized protein with von Willebrand factor type A (vWA) domain
LIGPDSGVVRGGASISGGGLANAPDLAEVTGRLGLLLHSAGVPVTPERDGRLAAAMVLVAPATMAELYWLARITLIAEHGHIAIFDRVFAQIFGGFVDPADFRGDAATRSSGSTTTRPTPDMSAGPSSPNAVGDQPARPLTASEPGGAAGEAAQSPGVLAAFSADERLRHQDFARWSAQELAELRALTDRMVFATPPRRSRRRVPAGRGRQLDVRAMLRRARRTGGEPLVEVRRARRSRPRRLVLICDISGSMEPYARAYLQLLMSGVDGARAEAFVFATRLTRLTRVLRGANPAIALEQAGRTAPDWSGGTRIGTAIKAFNDQYGRRGLARGAVVVVLSDGWDRGDPEILGREMARLRRLAFRIVWVNPRKAAPQFAPLTGGMAAALPHVDAFVSGHSLAALEEVIDAIGQPETRARN